MTGVATLLLVLSSLAAGQAVHEPTTQPALTSAPASTPAAIALLPSLVEVELRLERSTIPVGSPVIGEFVIRNRTMEPVTLQVPGTDVGHQPFAGMGLPLEHVFSGERFRALKIAAEGNATLGDRIANKPDYAVPLITVAPLASIGLKFDLSRFYPVLHQAGRYDISWSPYGGSITTPTVALNVVNYKVVVLETNQGRLTMRMLYEKAPKSVANFLDLVGSRFYNGKTFHRVEPNFIVAGGCPLGVGTGRRPDGRTIDAELNDTPFTLGTVGMSLAPNDPNSASCQFFISLGRHDFLDGHYTAFAQIEGPESMETLRRMQEVETDVNKRPTKPLTIRSAVVLDAPTLR